MARILLTRWWPAPLGISIRDEPCRDSALDHRHHAKAGFQRQQVQWEVADIFRRYGKAYCQNHKLPAAHRRIMRAIEMCRTAYLGGHVEVCDHCGFRRNAYNSCRNRHCPKCQSLAKARWLKARSAELLPVPYFHNVFTLPHELNALILCNKRALLNLLFEAVSATLLSFGRNNLGGQLGFIAILHTWDQRLLDHFHLHCLIPGGALSFDRQRWIATKDNFLFRVELLSTVFRGKYLSGLKRLYSKGKLQFPGNIAHLKLAKEFQSLIDGLYAKDWVVFSKGSVKKPGASGDSPESKHLLDYLARYTHKVAISNHRIKSIDDGQVIFAYKDRQDKNTNKLQHLNAEEFIRRFLLHILPEGFMRIRHYGFLANRYKKTALKACRKLLGAANPMPAPLKPTVRELMQILTGKDIQTCPVCKKAPLRIKDMIPALYLNRSGGNPYWDTS